jgi:hypothetical protein
MCRAPRTATTTIRGDHHGVQGQADPQVRDRQRHQQHQRDIGATSGTGPDRPGTAVIGP